MAELIRGLLDTTVGQVAAVLGCISVALGIISSVFGIVSGSAYISSNKVPSEEIISPESLQIKSQAPNEKKMGEISD